MAEQSNKVFVRRGLSYEDLPALTEAVEAIFAQSPAAQRLGRESRVLLKPNLLAKHPPEHAVTTHPAVVEAVATVLRRREVGRIILADSCGGLYTEGGMRSIYRASGLAEVCERMGVELWDKTTSAPRACDGALVHEFNLITPVQECDFIIDLPKFKTHVMTGMTAAVKNLFGCIPGLQKAEMHMRFPDRERFGQMLCDLAGAVAPDLVILDAIVGMEGDGPAGGHPRALGMLLGGSGPVAGGPHGGPDDGPYPQAGALPRGGDPHRGLPRAVLARFPRPPAPIRPTRSRTGSCRRAFPA